MKFLAFGEMLWDIFEDKKTLGGAPFNLCTHMSKLGFNSYILSALGDDELGREFLKYIKELKINDNYIQISPYQTGITNIILEKNNATYTFNENCAWDNINDSKIDEILKENYDIFYFGSLSQRSLTSKNTLYKILSKIKTKEIFFDINIRKNFYSKEILTSSLKACTILKLNEDEVKIIREELGYKDDDFILDLMDEYKIKIVLLTLGKDGSKCFYKDKVYKQGIINSKVIDTVGAGDSFSAGFLFAYSHLNDIEKALDFAAKIAAFIVSNTGAISEYNKNILNLVDKIRGKYV